MFSRSVYRILESLGVLFLVSFFVFSIAKIIPGDLALQLTGVDGATKENIARVRLELGLDKPFYLQFWNWLMEVLRGDFGVSPLTNRSIWTDVHAALPVSLQLAAFALLFSVTLGTPIGIIAAVYSTSRIGQAIRTGLIVILSIPSFVIGALLVYFSSRYFPSLFRSLFVRITEDLGENLRVMTLPTIALGLALAGVIAQVTRNAVVQELNQTYVTTARAYGLPGRTIVLVYALRGAIVQILTVAALLFGSIVGGTVITERVFSLPGLGNLMVRAIGNRDFNLAIVAILFVTLTYLVLNTLVDILAERLDPRSK
jgi:peptide/nickel transport system permease protein